MDGPKTPERPEECEVDLTALPSYQILKEAEAQITDISGT